MADQLSLDQIDEMYRAAEAALDAVIAKAEALKAEIADVDWQINALPRLYERAVFSPSKWIEEKGRRLVAETGDAAWNANHMRLGLLFRYWTTDPRLTDTFDTYEKKLKFVARWNEYMREAGAAFEHPETKEPSLLLAVTSRGDAGRFTLESRITKKRSGSYKTLRDLAVLKIIKDVPRKEGFVEQRKRAEKKREKGGEE